MDRSQMLLYADFHKAMENNFTIRLVTPGRRALLFGSVQGCPFLDGMELVTLSKIADELERETNQFTSTGAVHAALQRLERKGYVISGLGEARVAPKHDNSR